VRLQRRCVDHESLVTPFPLRVRNSVKDRAHPQRTMTDEALSNEKLTFKIISQPSIYIDGWLYGMRTTSVVCNVPMLSQNDSIYHHSVFTT